MARILESTFSTRGLRRLGPFLLLAILGCDDGSTIEVGYIGLPPYRETELLTVELEWPGGGRRITATEMTEGLTGTLTPPIDVPTAGTMRVRAWLVTSTDDTLGHVATDFGLDEDHSYGAFVQAGGLNPNEVCIPVADSAALLDPTSLAPAGDSVFLILLGLPEGVAC